MFMNCGVILQKRRKQLGFTQCQVAEGICTQGLISMIESGKSIPTADVLYALSKRLKLSLEECFQPWGNELEHAQWIRSELKRCIRYRCYEELPKYLYEAKKNSFFQEGEAFSFLLWHESLYLFFVKREVKKAIEMVEKASEVIPYSDKFRLIELENTRGIYYADNREIEKAINIFQNALELWDTLTLRMDETLDIRIRHNLSKAHFALKNYEKALLHCDRAIERCVEVDTMCIYADLHYLKGQILFHKEEKEQSLRMFRLALHLFETSKQIKFLEITQQKINELFPNT
jgi:tetratricopeptide (TPR) repeat protein